MSAEILNFPTKDGWQRALYENKIKAAMFIDGRPYAVRRIAQATWEEFLKLYKYEKNIKRF